MKNIKAQIPIGEEKVVFKGKFYEVIHQDMQCENEIKLFERVKRCPGTRNIVMSKDKKILISREYRHEVNGYDYRLPGGKVFDSLEEYSEFNKSGKDIIEVAKKNAKIELMSEVGIDAKSFEHFHISICGTTVEWNLIYFIVTDFIDLGKRAKHEAGEDITPFWMTKQEVINLCLEGKISEDRTVGVLLRYLLQN